MKYLVAVMALVAAASASATTVYFDNGTSIEVPSDKRLVLVPKGTPPNLWTLGSKIKVKPLRAPRSGKIEEQCAAPGELVVGPMRPCEEGGLTLGPGSGS